MSILAKYNDNVNFLFTAIDVFTNKAYVRALKNKKAETVLSTFKDILKESGKVMVVWSDFGSEFKNSNIF
jgi:DNA polymerase III gamma/tau subunit